MYSKEGGGGPAGPGSVAVGPARGRSHDMEGTAWAAARQGAASAREQQLPAQRARGAAWRTTTTQPAEAVRRRAWPHHTRAQARTRVDPTSVRAGRVAETCCAVCELRAAWVPTVERRGGQETRRGLAGHLGLGDGMGLAAWGLQVVAAATAAPAICIDGCRKDIPQSAHRSSTATRSTTGRGAAGQGPGEAAWW